MQSPATQVKHKPPYLLGLLCIIPLVGAFVGFGLLLYGLLKYKDKKLSMIGAGGILWTIIVYSALFYAGTYLPAITKGWIPMSQKQLNTLVPHIEFYKLQHGHYPDSLEQISTDDNVVFITDPIGGMKSRKNDYFLYVKLDDKYAVYSAGEDDIPNTADDVYPNIPVLDSSKIGLIRFK